MNFFNQSIPLGRWFRITVVIHWTFLLYAGNELLLRKSANPGLAALFLALLFGTVLVHEFGHALSCRAVGGEANHIVLWPLGGIAFVQPPMNPRAWLITTVCGPAVNAVLWPVFYLVSQVVVTRYYGVEVWDYVHGQISNTTGIVTFDASLPVQICLYMWQINRLLLLFNLIPAYPMDGGRILQEVLWMVVGYPRSLKIAGMVGTVAGGAFIVLGLGLHEIRIPALNLSLGGQISPILAIMGLLCAMESLAIYRRAAEIKGWQKN
jgi:Zn-dependent protease